MQYGKNGFPGRFQLHLNYGQALISKRGTHHSGFDLGVEGFSSAGMLYGNMGVAVQARLGMMTRSLYTPQPGGNFKSWESFIFIRSQTDAVGWNLILTGSPASDVTPAPLIFQHELGEVVRGPKPIPEISFCWSLLSRETTENPSQPFQAGHIDYRQGLQSRSPWLDRCTIFRFQFVLVNPDNPVTQKLLPPTETSTLARLLSQAKHYFYSKFQQPR